MTYLYSKWCLNFLFNILILKKINGLSYFNLLKNNNFESNSKFEFFTLIKKISLKQKNHNSINNKNYVTKVLKIIRVVAKAKPKKYKHLV